MARPMRAPPTAKYVLSQAGVAASARCSHFLSPSPLTSARLRPSPNVLATPTRDARCNSYNSLFLTYFAAPARSSLRLLPFKNSLRRAKCTRCSLFFLSPVCRVHSCTGNSRLRLFSAISACYLLLYFATSNARCSHSPVRRVHICASYGCG
ncbi:hypothetical protein B0H12DRAFT_1325578 [Mycena haematopus]|nr:hypothetical protein B0H12DRAFT_1325578 [Mycena haematopus]